MSVFPPQNNSQDPVAITKKIEEIRRREEEQRAKNLANKLGLSYLNLIMLPVEADAIRALEENKARKGKMAIIKQYDKKLSIAVVDPNDNETKQILEELSALGFTWNFAVVSLHSLEKVWNHYKEFSNQTKEIAGTIAISVELLKNIENEIKTLDDIRGKIKTIPANEASKIVEVIIAGALKTNSSDIHIESKEKETILRYRIDGLLREIASLSKKFTNLIISRIKLLSQITLNVHDVAQDGRFTIKLDEYDIENRVSVLPGPYGENIVIRVLNPKSIKPGLKDLGLREDLYQIIEKQIKKPNGMLVTTGPTGSGKTTALYAFLKASVTPEVKIITLEDPIEYHLPGIVQTQVETEKGYTFASGLRAILRQDPDIVLVGEIRDKETAETAVNAALTGHLVFSTLHTNDAAGAIPRFIELDIKPNILSSAINIIMAQRLVRTICPQCKKEIKPDKETIEKIKNSLKNLSKEIFPIDIDKPFNLYHGQGCSACDNIGYKGRTAIFEIIEITKEIEKLISNNPSHITILEIMIKNGISSMYQDGIIKVLEGMTTIEEIEKTIQPIKLE